MISFQCPQCGTEMESPSSQAGKTESCPKCGAPSPVPPAATPPPMPDPFQTSPAMPMAPAAAVAPLPARPPMPGTIKWGLGFYAGAFVISMFSSVIYQTGMEPITDLSDMGPAMGWSCASVPSGLLSILGIVMACVGRRWGAILLACMIPINILLGVIAASVSPIPLINPGAFLAWGLLVGSILCVLLPDSMTYYRKIDAYRVKLRSV